MHKLFTALLVSAVFGAASVVPAQGTYPGAVSRIAFGSSGTGGNIDVYTASPSGALDPRRLTNAQGLDACPAYSPDGETIAFCSERTGKFEIWLMNADGGGQRQLTFRRYDADWPDFSADGRRIAFQTTDGGPAGIDIYVIARSGGKVQRLTGAPGNDRCPAFSPSGKLIAFVSERKGTSQVWLMKAADGRRQRQLTRDPAVKQECPDWRPDSRRIAYAAGGDIWVMNADGTAQKNLTSSPGTEYGPAWSPDGSTISYVRRIGGEKRLWIMNADGSSERALGGPGNQLVAAWQPLR